jgi:hypothetical protein
MERKQYIEYQNKIIAVAYLRKGTNKIDSCPFCNHEHEHNGPGHRQAHCKEKNYFTEITTVDGTRLFQDDGYFVIEY